MRGPSSSLSSFASGGASSTGSTSAARTSWNTPLDSQTPGCSVGETSRCDLWKIFFSQNLKLSTGSGCGKVGRAVAYGL